MRRDLLAGVMVTGLAAAVTMGVAACALSPTGITDGSGRVARVSPSGPYVYFYVDGTLRPLPRDRASATADDSSSLKPPLPTAGFADDPQSKQVWLSLESLRHGPTAAERSAGVTTEVPEEVPLTSISVTGDAIVVAVGMDGQDLSDRALTQIGCTLTSAMSVSGRVWTGTITVVKGPGITRRAVPPCDVTDLTALPYAA